ncbi:MAG: MFS transporter [Burkholderiaceae bacterium]|nr:MFS transporter [Burkholderiaceae bacterium]
MLWLLQFCAARAAFATMFTAWSAVLPLLRTDWQISASQAGMVQSAYHVGFLISLFAVGFLSDRHGARRIYLLSSVAAVVSGLIFAVFADGFVSALLLYGLTGLCAGGSYTPGLAIIAQRMRERQGRALGFYLAAASLGYAVGLLIASAMIPLAGWRSAFIVTACFPVLGLVLGYRALRDVPNIVHPVPDGHGTRRRLLEVMRNKPAMLSIWGYTFHAWELLGMWAWLPAFLAAAAIASGTVGTQAVSLGATLTALTYLAAVVGSVLGGSLSDRWGRTTVTLMMALASLVCSFSFGWMIGLPMFLLVAVAVFYNVTGVADSSIHSTTLTELTDPRYLGAAYSLRSVLGFGAGAIAPWVFGLVLDWGRAGDALPEHFVWGLAWSTLGLGGLLGPVVIWRLRHLPEAVKLAGGKR